ncbi:Hypothetical_protein [Hexamita inflata]|uniref:Hypothetical_protein n=1 Tax=Hexamita inflata TaxID=28002 RepID=A0AA86NSP5_9EUKA|nr:Hypothetical protein HINF_LOCUS12396 [Hexamita inflata]
MLIKYDKSCSTRQIAIIGNFVRNCGMLCNITTEFLLLFVLILASLHLSLITTLIPDFIQNQSSFLNLQPKYWKIYLNLLGQVFQEPLFNLYLKQSTRVNLIYDVQISMKLVVA